MPDMDMVPDDETGGFSFIWTIENFSYCLQRQGEPLSSPRFKLDLSNTNDWYVTLYPRGCQRVDTIGVFLYEQGSNLTQAVKCISIRANDGTFKRRNEDANGFGYRCFLNHSDLFKKGNDAYLQNDTLVLRCRIRSEIPPFVFDGQCYARTEIEVRQVTFAFVLKNFKKLLPNERNAMDFHAASSNNQSYNIAVFITGEMYDKRKIQVEITQNQPYQKSLLTCETSLIDANGRHALSIEDDHYFCALDGTQTWSFPFMPLQTVLDNEELFLQNGELSLLFEFDISSGEEYSVVDVTEYDLAEDLDKLCFNKTVTTSSPGSLKDNLKRFYKAGKFSDLTMRTASNKEFPVHKAILCARSEVFSAMFEHDTKENRTCVIEIEDLNDDTVSKMLAFIYSDIVEDLEWGTASELYFAADKYGIAALKSECSSFVKDNTKSSNVCEVLILADMHQDQDLKSSAQDFIVNHATEIIDSDSWKKFIKDHSNLAAEAMHLLCMRNLKM